jgi:hypothetical protein
VLPLLQYIITSVCVKRLGLPDAAVSPAYNKWLQDKIDPVSIQPQDDMME